MFLMQHSNNNNSSFYWRRMRHVSFHEALPIHNYIYLLPWWGHKVLWTLDTKYSYIVYLNQASHYYYAIQLSTLIMCLNKYKIISSVYKTLASSSSDMRNQILLGYIYVVCGYVSVIRLTFSNNDYHAAWE